MADVIRFFGSYERPDTPLPSISLRDAYDVVLTENAMLREQIRQQRQRIDMLTGVVVMGGICLAVVILCWVPS